MQISLKTKEEIELCRQSSLLVGKTLAQVASALKAGVSTLELDKIAETFIKDSGATPSFLGYNGFSGSLCISVNEEIVHGIPGKRVIKEGDLVSIDCGVFMNGFHGDSAYTFGVEEIDEKKSLLLKITKESLLLAIDTIQPGSRIGDIGNAVQQHAQKNGFGVVRELVGHGLGRNLHEKPEIPNYGKRGSGLQLKDGMVIAIEPMINMGSRHIRQLNDGWTIVTSDHKPSAHFEHDIAIVEGNADVLTTFEFIEKEIEKNSNLYKLI
ncbi:MAG TPA: type I methionyl aminopeptidase [Bacteroidia bacterium]|nr:type I methionyl aminopeptidase [Bacteroidia bacterium]